jgi:hypothetical protein
MENGTNAAELSLLNRFAGNWDTTGTLITKSGTVNIAGTDHYAWLPGGHFLMHTVDVMMGEDRKQSVEIIGFDTLSGTYPMHFYDDAGESGVMHGGFDEDYWLITSSELRFKGAFSDNNNTLTGSWEQYSEGSWRKLMDIRLIRAAH